MASLEGLLSQISQNESQLAQVNEFLAADPHNADFLQLRDDLFNAIAMTNDLIRVQEERRNMTHASISEITAPHEVKSEQQHNLPPSSKKAHKEEEVDTRNDNNDSNNNNEDNDEFEERVDLRVGPIDIGEVVEVSGADRPYPGVLLEYLNEGKDCRVKYFEFADEVNVPLPLLTRIPLGGYAAHEVFVGLKCQCKYATDQRYYDAEIKARTEHGYHVTYTQYLNSEEVPLEYLRPKLARKGDKKGAKTEDKSMALRPIPEKLKILPTDTEEEKIRKKKKIKAIKSVNREIEKETELKEVQNSWQKFRAKGSKRALEGLTKQSMFAAPDKIEGKVGVTNSGKGMTEYIHAKRNKFESL